MSVSALLTIRDLTHQFTGRTRIAFGSMTLDAGSILLVRGTSGCGKSTLLHLLGGVLPVASGSGSVVIDGYELAGMSARDRDHLRPAVVGWMPQRQFLINGLSVLDNVLLPVLLNGKANAEMRARANGLLKDLAISELSDARPATLSVGQAARASLARALLTAPRLLLADEPTAALDETSSTLVAKQIISFANEGGAAVVASHDPHLRALLAAGAGEQFSEIGLPR